MFFFSAGPLDVNSVIIDASMETKGALYTGVTMITTTPQRRATRKHLPRLPGFIAALVLPLMLAACTNSKLLVTPLYNQLDDKIISAFTEMGDFDKTQTRAIEQAAGTFHVWHRQSELPQYAALLQDIAGSITDPDNSSDPKIATWVSTAESFLRSARECHPANFMISTMKTLSHEQINDIEKSFENELNEDRERFASRTPEEYLARRVKNIDKWAGRIDLELTRQQRDALRDSYSRQISLRQQYLDLSEVWNQKFFAMVRSQQDDNYESRIQSHFSQRSQLLETSYPDEWQKNRQLLQQTVQQFVHSLDPQQRRSISRWMGKMGSTLEGVSRDKPSFKPGTDASVGCLVQAGS